MRNEKSKNVDALLKPIIAKNKAWFLKIHVLSTIADRGPTLATTGGDQATQYSQICEFCMGDLRILVLQICEGKTCDFCDF